MHRRDDGLPASRQWHRIRRSLCPRRRGGKPWKHDGASRGEPAVDRREGVQAEPVVLTDRSLCVGRLRQQPLLIARNRRTAPTVLYHTSTVSIFIGASPKYMAGDIWKL
jgi:hypothetical protein